jgi:membrane dipeptidase
MKRSTDNKAWLASGVLMLFVGALASAHAAEVPPEVKELHDNSIVADLHADTQFMVTYMGYNLAKRHHPVSWGQSGVGPLFSDIDLPRLREGGIDLFNMAVCPVPKDNKLPGAVSYVKRSLNAIDRAVAKNADSLAVAHSPEEAQQIIASGRIAVLLGLEGGSGIGNDLGLLREYYDRGVRYMTLTHAKDLDWAWTASDKHQSRTANVGLTDFGQQVVREMEKMGMMIDLAHVSEKTFWATLDSVKCPVVVTHAAARGLAEHPRNLTDAQIQAVAQRGGVIGVIFYDKYLDPAGTKPKNVGLIADHIDYIKKIAGIDVIALGSDFDGNVTTPPDLADASMMLNLTAELHRRGYPDREIKKILGENFLRAWAKIQSCASK